MVGIPQISVHYNHKVYFSFMLQWFAQGFPPYSFHFVTEAEGVAPVWDVAEGKEKWWSEPQRLLKLLWGSGMCHS